MVCHGTTHANSGSGVGKENCTKTEEEDLEQEEDLGQEYGGGSGLFTSTLYI